MSTNGLQFQNLELHDLYPTNFLKEKEEVTSEMTVGYTVIRY